MLREMNDMDIKTKYLSEREEDLAIAADILRRNGTVIFPTETVYGLGANALSASAVKKIFSAKGRPSDNPLIVHIGNQEILGELVKEVPEKAKLLIEKFWPGPLTLIFQKSDLVPKVVTGGMDTVAVRMPSHPTARRLLEISEIPVAAPSANRSGLPSPTVFPHVKEDMDGRVDAIIMGGDCEVGVESTVLDMSGNVPTLYRPGLITLEQLEEILGTVRVITAAKKGEKPKSPGLKYRHYAPNARVEILQGNLEQVRTYAKSCCDNEKTGMLVFEEFPVFDERLLTVSLGKKKDSKSAAHNLFAGLRELDEMGVTLILAPEIPDIGIWSAVKNRLYRAAGEKVVNLDRKIGNVLFVCTGNTCRSPMAEGLFRDRMEKNKNKNFVVRSAGLFADERPVSGNAKAVMDELGIDISKHYSQQITREMVEEADLILTMTESHANMLLAVFPDVADKICTLAGWAETEGEVQDPYGGTMEDYRNCRNQLEKLIERGCQNNL